MQAKTVLSEYLDAESREEAILAIRGVVPKIQMGALMEVCIRLMNNINYHSDLLSVTFLLTIYSDDTYACCGNDSFET